MNRADLVYHNAQVRAQNYSQAIKLRIEQARQQRGAVLALGAGNDICGVQNVLQSISCECEVLTFASDNILASFQSRE